MPPSIFDEVMNLQLESIGSGIPSFVTPANVILSVLLSTLKYPL